MTKRLFEHPDYMNMNQRTHDLVEQRLQNMRVMLEKMADTTEATIAAAQAMKEQSHATVLSVAENLLANQRDVLNSKQTDPPDPADNNVATSEDVAVDADVTFSPDTIAPQDDEVASATTDTPIPIVTP